MHLIWVLKAAHCVYDRTTRDAYSPKDLVFNAGLQDGKAAYMRGISAIAAHNGNDSTEALSAKNVSHDVALLRLSSPIPFSEMDPFALHTDVVKNGPVCCILWSWARRCTVPSRECQMTDRQDDVLIFDCDVTFRPSGAPVFSHLNARGLCLLWNGANSGKKGCLGHVPSAIDCTAKG